MLQTDPLETIQTPHSARPVLVFGLWSLVIAAVLSVASLVWLRGSFVPAGGFALVCVITGHALLTRYPHGALGLCNVVTLIRAGLVALLAGAVVEGAVSSWWIFGLAAIAFALDGADGWLARRSGLVSAFGARFDMETDAALGAVLSIAVLVGGTAGPEILILGFARYAFVIAGWFVPKLRSDLPESLRRKTICVVQIAALLFLICPLAPGVLMVPVAQGAAVLLAFSFAVDVRWLLRR